VRLTVKGVRSRLVSGSAGSLRSFALAFLVVAAVAGPAAIAPGTACAAAASDAPHAALAIDTGASESVYCVALDAESVSGTHLIQLAGSQFGVEYRLGFGGRAVCMLAGVGVDGPDCFGAYPDFWGYWHGDATRGWTWASTSAADHSVESGDVEGWSWGSGDSGATHPAPTQTAIDDACRGAIASAPGTDTGDGADPVGGIVAIGAIALLGMGGWFTLRRTRGAP
jgi:hypothetical protein